MRAERPPHPPPTPPEGLCLPVASGGNSPPGSSLLGLPQASLFCLSPGQVAMCPDRGVASGVLHPPQAEAVAPRWGDSGGRSHKKGLERGKQVRGGGVEESRRN